MSELAARLPGWDAGQALAFCSDQWETTLIPRLSELIEVPALSPVYDPDWERNGHLDRVAEMGAAWARTLPLPGIEVEILRQPGRTPLVFVDVPGTIGKTVLFYGHLDKQPGGDGWGPDSGPWTPRYDGTHLYGRGGADDGYALFAALTSIEAVEQQGLPRPRCIGVFEASEESGSPDLSHWLSVLAPRMPDVDLVVCLDSGAGDYDRLWLVSSLRGHCGGRLDVRVLETGAHSGDAGGVVPSSFRVLRRVLERIEDSETGEVLLSSARCPIPEERMTQAKEAAAVLGPAVVDRFAWHEHADEDVVEPVTADPTELLLNRAWRPSLAVTGAEGLPPIASAGNVLRPSTSLKLSLRLAPLADTSAAVEELEEVLTREPPHRAAVTFTPDTVLVDGWNAPPLDPWLHDSLEGSSHAYFGASLALIGQGGSIPLMGMLGRAFPDAQFLACGVQGPGANAHGPNESLHVPYAKRLTASIACVLVALGREAS